MDERPNGVSVVVAAFSGEEALARCLESLARQTTAAEVIASTDLGCEALERLARRFPGVQFLSAAPGAGAFRLRALGVAQARGGLVALTEDHCTAAPGWLEGLRAAHAAGRAVVGGVVENGHAATPHGRALYWCEYAAEMPPLPDGPAPILSGVNVAYDCEALHACRETWQELFYESEVHAALQRAGHRLHRVASAVVTSHLAFSFRQAMAHLYRGGRRFGQERLARSSAWFGLVLRVAVGVVPALLTWRVVIAVASRRRREIGQLVLALPVVACLTASWGAGEAMAYWGGRGRT